ncbi:MAG TPA: hypothetical protein VHW69_07935 [Rhizomicrobium sp.]|nr:hypothetical protein [Rhizomicrobium sp.]
MAKRFDWDKAKHDAIKYDLVPTGEDINDAEEAELRFLHDAKNGVYPVEEPPTQRDKATLDLPTWEDRLHPVESINKQVALRAERRKRGARNFQSFARLRSKPTGKKGPR